MSFPFSFLLTILLSLSSISSASRSFPSDPTVHIAMTLDSNYLRGTLAAVSSLVKHSSSPLHFHFITTHSSPSIPPILPSSITFSLYPFAPSLPLISSSSRPALRNPLNYARFYLPHLLPPSLPKIIYLDSDIIALDDISRLWSSSLLNSPSVIAAPEYCHVNISRYFNRDMSSAFAARRGKPCYFNTGVMVIDLVKWREGEYTRKVEGWMRVQKEERIYELGSLPPLLLVFAGDVEGVEHRWNQHGLGGDNVSGECREVHPGPVSLLHWSGKDKPWDRLDQGRPCPVDHLWKPYDVL